MQHYQTLQQANSYITAPDGTRRYSRYEIGVIDGRYRAMPVLVADKAGFDGLGFDASVGSNDDHYTVLNLFDGSHKYIDSVAVVGADDDDHAAHLALSQFDYLGADYATVVVNDSAQFDDMSLDALGQRGWSSQAIAQLMNHPSQNTGYYLPIINSKMLRTEQNRVTADNVMWDGANLVSHGSDYSRLLLDLQKHDAFGGLTAKFDMRDLLADLGATELGFDALMETYSRLDAMGDRLFTALGRHAVGDLTVTNVTTTKPFKRQGVANVAMQFDLSDGQTFSIIFHNPDADPKKLAANDMMVSWKWLLNKKDVTAAVSPKQSDKVRYDVIASRIMKVAAKNSKRFVAAQMKKAENQEKITEAQKAVDDKQAYLEQLDKDIAELKQQIDDFRLSDEARIKAGNTLQDKHARIVGGINIDPIIERMKKDDVFHDSTAVEWFNDSLAKYDMSHNYSDLPSELRGALRIINAITNGDTRDVYYIVDSINANFAKKFYRAAVAEHFDLSLTIDSRNDSWQKAIAELYAAKGMAKEQFEQAFMLGQTQHKQAVEAEQAARREQEAQRQAEIDASEAQYQAQKAAEEQYIRDWLPNADAKTIGRIKKVLETNVQYTSGWFNGVATRKQFIETVIQAGGQPKTEMRRKWIPAKGDSLGDTRPYEPARWSETKVYVLEDDTGTTSIDISKTEYDYAVYLLQKASAPQAGHSTEMVKLDLTAANPLDEQQVINEYATDNNAFDGDYIDTFKDDRDIFNAIDKAQNALAEKGYPAWAIATANGDYVAVYILPDGKFSSSDMRESAESAYQNMLTSRENQIKYPDRHNAKVLADRNAQAAQPHPAYSQDDIAFLNDIVSGKIEPLPKATRARVREIGSKDKTDPLFLQVVDIISDATDKLTRG